MSRLPKKKTGRKMGRCEKRSGRGSGTTCAARLAYALLLCVTWPEPAAAAAKAPASTTARRPAEEAVGRSGGCYVRWRGARGRVVLHARGLGGAASALARLHARTSAGSYAGSGGGGNTCRCGARGTADAALNRSAFSRHIRAVGAFALKSRESAVFSCSATIQAHILTIECSAVAYLAVHRVCGSQTCALLCFERWERLCKKGGSRVEQ